MTLEPCAKINLGLNIIRKRPDGYHDLETVFLPVPLTDKLTVETRNKDDDYEYACRLTVTGDAIECDEQTNLVTKAYKLLAEEFVLPKIDVTLNKRIPSQAGMGGGSSDASFMIRLLNEQYDLMMTPQQMEAYAAKLGGDCAFFVKAQPAYAEGIGDKLYPMPGLMHQLKGMKLAIVKPALAISTREAFQGITPKCPKKNCLEIVSQPIETWCDELTNDFEESLFPKYPELEEIKRTLYRYGAKYASMSGSGSTIFGFFDSIGKVTLSRLFPECKTYVVSL